MNLIILSLRISAYKTVTLAALIANSIQDSADESQLEKEMRASTHTLVIDLASFYNNITTDGFLPQVSHQTNPNIISACLLTDGSEAPAPSALLDDPLDLAGF